MYLHDAAWNYNWLICLLLPICIFPSWNRIQRNRKREWRRETGVETKRNSWQVIVRKWRQDVHGRTHCLFQMTRWQTYSPILSCPVPKVAVVLKLLHYMSTVAATGELLGERDICPHIPNKALGLLESASAIWLSVTERACLGQSRV